MQSTSLSKPGLNVVSPPPDWASAGELKSTANPATTEHCNAMSRRLFTIRSVPSIQFRPEGAHDRASQNFDLGPGRFRIIFHDSTAAKGGPLQSASKLPRP